MQEAFSHLSQVERQAGHLRPPEGHAEVVEDQLRHLDNSKSKVGRGDGRKKANERFTPLRSRLENAASRAGAPQWAARRRVGDVQCNDVLFEPGLPLPPPPLFCVCDVLYVCMIFTWRRRHARRLRNRKTCATLRKIRLSFTEPLYFLTFLIRCVYL